jgi:two-component system OmpR family sensor kinase
MNEAASRGKIARRATVAAIGSAAIGGLLASAVAILAVDWLIADHADRRLGAAASMLIGELEEERDENDGDTLADILDDENQEGITSGIRLAVFEQGILRAGDPWVPHVGAQRCVSRGELGQRVRACAERYQAFSVVAAEERDEAMLRWLYLLSGALAVVVGGGLGGISSLRLTRWAITPDRPDPKQLSEASGVQEVDEIRTALADLLLRSRAHVAHVERFAADAAHELRTPLTLLRTELELLAEETRDEQAREPLKRLARRVTLLSDLIQRLLVLASPEEQLSAGFEAVSLADVVAAAVAELPYAMQKRVSTFAMSEALVKGDPALLRSMVVNALDNALKFSQGPVEVRIDDPATENNAQPPDAQPSAMRIVLEVSDCGVGIPEDLHERVFEPFFRIRADATPGHGLGLSLIGHIARTHGGSVSLSNKGPGTRVRIALPPWSA